MINLVDKQRFRYVYSLNSAAKVKKKQYPFIHVAPQYVSSSVPYEPIEDWTPWLLAWYRSDYVELNGSNVSVMYDKTPNGRNLVRHEEYAAMPTYTVSDPVFNGKPSVNFYTLNCMLTGTVWELGQDGVGYTYFFVYSPAHWYSADYTGGHTLYDFSVNKTGLRQHSALYRENQLALSLQGQAVYMWPGVIPFETYWPPRNTPQCFTVADNTGSWRRTSVWVTGTLVLDDYDNISGTRPQYLGIGGNFTSYFGAPIYPFSGSYAEILIFSGTLPKAGITAIHKYIGSRYNIASMM
jgi:hypothetical protein